MKKAIIFLFRLVVTIFALAGFGLLAAYAAVSFHLTDTKGIVDEQSDSFWKNGKATAAILAVTNNDVASYDVFFNKQNYCFLKSVKDEYPGDFTRIINLALAGNKDLAQKNADALKIVLNKNNIQDCNITNVSKQDFEVLAGTVDFKSPFIWDSSEEWDFFKTSVLKDKDILDRVQKETGVNSRALVSQLMAEQMRLFYSDRPWFKKAISPLKVLGSMTQFSWGVFGIKPETAQRIEANLKNPKSDYYLGADFENLLDFKTKDVAQERFQRITDSKDHYYAYLYAALYNKEIMTQWQRAGFDISDRPEILATLFNIGFAHSKPDENPQVGGSELQIGESTYSFGRLAFEFYYSGELLTEFPQYAKPKSDVVKGSNLTASMVSPDENVDWPYWISLFLAF